MFLEKGIHELFVFLHVERESQSNTFLAIIGSNKHEWLWLGCVWFGLFFGRRLFVGFWLVDLDVASVCSHKSSIFLPERGDGDGLCGREWWDTKEVELNSFFVHWQWWEQQEISFLLTEGGWPWSVLLLEWQRGWCWTWLKRKMCCSLARN